MRSAVKHFILALSVMAASAAAETRLMAEKPLVWRDFLGVNAHFLWFTPPQAAAQMERLRSLGLEWTRVDLHWDRHESTENNFNYKPIDSVVDALKARQLKSVFYLVGSAPLPAVHPPLRAIKINIRPKMRTSLPGVWVYWHSATPR